MKGWAVDRAGEILVAGGIERFCLGAGGDVLARGGRAPGVPWRIGIAHPQRAGASALTLEAEDLAVATSGSTERGHHIVDGRTGEVPRELLTLSVAGPEPRSRRRLCHGRLRHGPEGLRWVESLPGYAALRHDAGRAAHRDPRPAALPARELTSTVRHG